MKRPVRRALPILAVACLIAGGMSCSSSASSCATYTNVDTVTLRDFSFDPGCSAASRDTTLTITNEGAAPHSFTVKDTAINVQVDPGDTTTVDLKDVAPGSYTVVCTYHPDMVGGLKIG